MVTNKVMPYTDYSMTPCIQKVFIATYMSVPTRKPPLWHFIYSDAICLHSYNVCKDDNFTKFWKLYTIACMLYFCCMRNYFTKMELFNCLIQNSALIWKHSIFPQGRFSYGPTHICIWSTMYNHYANSHISCLWLEKDLIWVLGTKINLKLELCIVSMYWNSPILCYTMMIPSLMLPMT